MEATKTVKIRKPKKGERIYKYRFTDGGIGYIATIILKTGKRSYLKSQIAKRMTKESGQLVTPRDLKGIKFMK